MKSREQKNATLERVRSKVANGPPYQRLGGADSI